MWLARVGHQSQGQVGEGGVEKPSRARAPPSPSASPAVFLCLWLFSLFQPWLLPGPPQCEASQDRLDLGPGLGDGWTSLCGLSLKVDFGEPPWDSY